MTHIHSSQPWWQTATFYQIYPRSFADGNGDGIGDIPGIITKLDYLQDLGINAIWLSPHFPSPLFDCGYDIADYTNVAPEYGTLDDFKHLLDGLHQRGMRLILDLVLNHTSDQHSWFIESRSSRTAPKRDWYIWRDGKNGGPPNNWNSTFGGSAWEYDSQTDQYFYHFFFKQQPDLNWRNPQVKQAMFDAMRFWLDMGVDGFRLDAIGTIYEHPGLPDHTAHLTLPEMRLQYEIARTKQERRAIKIEWSKMFRYQAEQPGMHELLQELRQLVDEYEGDRLLVGETEDLSYQGNGHNQLHMVFNFPLMNIPKPAKILTPTWIRNNQKKRLAALEAISPDAWPCNTLGNHDSSRLLSRFGDGQHDAQLARLYLTTLLCLRGTPFLYNGEEIGMVDLALDDVKLFRDQLGVWLYEEEAQLGIPSEQALRDAADLTRDKCRTPMQWANTPNAGFSPASAQTWLPVNPNYTEGINISQQYTDPNSLLNFYRCLLALRQQTPALQSGDYLPLLEHSRSVLAFLRRTEDQSILTVLNFTPHRRKACLPNLPVVRLLFSSEKRTAPVLTPSLLTLAPFEILIASMFLE